MWVWKLQYLRNCADPDPARWNKRGIQCLEVFGRWATHVTYAVSALPAHCFLQGPVRALLRAQSGAINELGVESLGTIVLQSLFN